MSDVQDEANEKLTLLGALKDFGWLPLSLISVGGGLALIDIAELVVFDGLTLITPFQIVLDGYQRVTALIGAIVEPLFQPAIDWINAHWHWHLDLQPFWRSLFVLGMVYVMGLVRGSWRDGSWGRSILSLIVMGLGALAGALAVGLLPFAGGWWAQGLVAATPLALLLFAREGAGAIYLAILRGSVRKSLAYGLEVYVVIGASAFVLGAGLSFVPGLSGGAGILVLGAFIAGMGAITLVIGLRLAMRNLSREGLSILGGFVAAGLILLSNWAVMALN